MPGLFLGAVLWHSLAPTETRLAPCEKNKCPPPGQNVYKLNITSAMILELKVIITMLLFSFQTEGNPQDLHIKFSHHRHLRNLIVLLDSLKFALASCCLC